MNARTVSRVMAGVLIFQLGIGALLVLGDMSLGTPRLPGLSPAAPRLSEPVRPGDQRRRFAPGRDGSPVQPLRDPGTLPDRLTLTQQDGTWRLEGAIADGDAARLADLIAQSDPRIETLILQSPGGSVRDALSLGRFLREAGIGTRLLAGEFCYSACPYLFAGGTNRTVEDGAQLGVHQHAFGENTLLPAFLAVEDIQRGQGDVMVYLDAMGIDPMVMSHALSTPADEIYVLLPDEIDRYGFVTQ
ncbi:hypothetical protein KUH32_11540 [Thalassococcus sp. CAU 1522]|uniref:Periplasmic protein n=1 Tax=Thalassococcus arenae TaxID=2851652 RepID=A0ABS6N8S8_9RHOB|nr:hypothetical protein [Thalassococcus arenae]MBV2360411.1 hypothetical protein [Thalassococcus arenae]